MKKASIIALSVFVVAVLGFVMFTGAPSTKEYLGRGFIESYRSTAGAVLLDVRTPAEFAAGHLDGAVNVDFESASFASDIQKLDKTTPYFVYCRSGNRSGQAITIMKKDGFTNISELQGGIVSNQSALTLVSTPM